VSQTENCFLLHSPFSRLIVVVNDPRTDPKIRVGGRGEHMAGIDYRLIWYGRRPARSRRSVKRPGEEVVHQAEGTSSSWIESKPHPPVRQVEPVLL